MKDFAKQIGLSTCILFTLFMLICSLIVIASVGPQSGITMTLTILVASAAFALLQGLWFTDKAIRHLAYPLRILGFGITGFIVLAACAWFGRWLPVDNIWAWASFAVIFLLILAAFCIGYQIYFRKTVGSFDAALARYHERMEREDRADR